MGETIGFGFAQDTVCGSPMPSKSTRLRSQIQYNTLRILCASNHGYLFGRLAEEGASTVQDRDQD